MSSETQYYCDVCEKEIPHQDVRTIGIKFNCDFNYMDIDICDKCYKEATKCLTAPIEQFEKKRLGSILKLWLSGARKGKVHNLLTKKYGED